MTNYREMLHRSVIGIPLIEVVPLIFFSDPQGNMMLIREKDALYWKMPGSSLTPDMNLTECLKASILNDFGVLIEESILLHIFSDPSQIYLDDDNTQVFPIYLVFLPVKIRGALRQKIENGSETVNGSAYVV